jgi:hypothetical protein
MHIQPITWTADNTNHLLIGNTNGLLSHIEMYVCMSNSICNGYEITSNIRGFVKQHALGLDNAKYKAQECLNAYAMSLILQ